MKTLYIDMDNVIVDFASGIAQLDKATQERYEGELDEVPGIFSKMKPMAGAVDAVKELCKYFDVYVLSTAPWLNPSAWTDKVCWIQKYFGSEKHSCLYKRLIISHHKNLNKGDYIIDDRIKNGVDKFDGIHLHFGTAEYPDWESVLKFLIK